MSSRPRGSPTARSSPLRSRDFALLMTGQLLSSAGTQLTTIAYPLLVLALTHSPAKAGFVGFARLLPSAAFALLAGVAADRWNRKRMMIVADGVRAVALASLAATILLDQVVFWQVALVAFVEGTGATFFGAAQVGALRAVVPRRELPAAVGVQEAQAATVRLAGPPLGGALFGLGRAIPFLVDAVSYAFSILALIAMRTPFQEEREVDRSRLRSQIADGFRFLWSHPFLRTCRFSTASATSRSERGDEQTDLAARKSLCVCTLVGSLLSPLFRRRLSIRTILLLELWAGLGSALFVVWPTVYVLTASILPQAVALPATDSVVVGYRVAITPDRLLGRVESVRSNVSLLIAPLGPLAAGLLLSSASARTTIAVFAGFALVLALWGTLSPSIRSAPALDELDDLAPPTPSRRQVAGG